jgi:hypothetical protein
MRINELIVESQQIDEISLAGIGKGIGKAANMAGKAVGGAVGGTVAAAKQFGSGVKQGYQGASDTVGGTQSSSSAPTSGGTTPATGGSAPATGGTAPATGGTAPAAPASNAGDIGSIMQTIDKLDKPTKQQLAGELEKNITATPEPAAEPAPATTPPAGGSASTTPPAGATPPGAPQYTDAERAAHKAAGGKYDMKTGEMIPPASTSGTAPAATPTGTAPAPTTPPAGGGKLTQAQQDAMKARLQGQRAAGKTTASQTGSGFNQYVQGGGGSTLAGADAQGNPVFKQNVQREDIAECVFYSKFLDVHI